MSKEDKKVGNIVDKMLTDQVTVVSTADGWVFSFTADMLRQLLEEAEISGTNRAILQVKSTEKMN